MTSHLHFEVSLSHRSKFDKRVALNWQTSEARYHVWVDIETLEPIGDYVGRSGICYKNSLLQRGQPGYFETRHLWLSSKPTGAMFARAQQIARNNKLVKVLLAHEAAERERKAEVLRQELREQRITDAAPELLEALLGFVAQYDTDRRTWPADMVALLDKANAAIALAEGMR